MKYEQTEKTDYYRDMHSGAVVNRNYEALRAYKKQKARAQKVDNMDERFNHIESEMKEIKQMFRNIIERLEND